MSVRVFLVFSSLLVLSYAQMFPKQPQGGDPKGVCTINGRVYYGIDCWCYTSRTGSVLLFSVFIILIAFFFLSGCIWTCIFRTYKRLFRRRDYEGASLHSSRHSLRRQTHVWNN
ncbi:CLUMA_CG008721, isoform A [Clunio marinus]|uniref:CLUMA_CG008721, isoform A n=1 Tax=Clunio marinus TaxID=568069 RepID=A0A1J1IAH2_9DIPT|nr:CLUMA_CG008721, isoform A [Clunio marinus]